MRDNGTRYAFDDLKSENKDLKAIVAKARKASSTSVPILLYGETGTGKEIFAQSIHNQSVNREEMFVAVNCAAIPETLMESLLFGTVKGVFTGAENNKGLLEQAGKGTLFLDEINSMSIDCQAKLLRVLQEKRVRKLGGGQEIPVFCRVISAINTDPQELIRKKKLREDFFLSDCRGYITDTASKKQERGHPLAKPPFYQTIQQNLRKNGRRSVLEPGKHFS